MENTGFCHKTHSDIYLFALNEKCIDIYSRSVGVLTAGLL